MSSRPLRLAGAATLGLALAGVALAGALGVVAGRSGVISAARPERSLHLAAAGLSASVLLDSAVEHARGGFRNGGMYAPLVASSAVLAAGAQGARGLGRKAGRRTAYGLAALVGAGGLGFHTANVLRAPGGLSWLNLFYRAPLGAPGALILAGLLGLAADSRARRRGRIALWFAGAGLLGASAEAALLHYRGSFQNPCMWAPVTVPPVAAGLTICAACNTRASVRAASRLALRLVALLGLVGAGLHAFGVSRAMGGWVNWRQNLFDGPPLPAPPSFTALALAGLAGLRFEESGGA